MASTPRDSIVEALSLVSSEASLPRQQRNLNQASLRSISGKAEITHQAQHQFWKGYVRQEKQCLLKSVARAQELYAQGGPVDLIAEGGH